MSLSNDDVYGLFVTKYQQLMKEGKRLPVGRAPPPMRPLILPGAQKALIFAPHPDDECLTGALPLRMLCEQGIAVIDVAVTLGRKRQEERKKELLAACSYLGFSVTLEMAEEFGEVNTTTREEKPATWWTMVQAVASLLEALRPKFVFMPHSGDAHPTHVGTSLLVADALGEMPHNFSCLVFESEIWQPNPAPNLMVGLDIRGVAELVTALTFHAGEISRNPYHLVLPAWMHDNVRRGSELVGGWGAAAPNFMFATLYRARKRVNGAMVSVFDKGRIIAPEDSLKPLCDL